MEADRSSRGAGGRPGLAHGENGRQEAGRAVRVAQFAQQAVVQAVLGSPAARLEQLPPVGGQRRFQAAVRPTPATSAASALVKEVGETNPEETGHPAEGVAEEREQIAASDQLALLRGAVVLCAAPGLGREGEVKASAQE